MHAFNTARVGIVTPKTLQLYDDSKTIIPLEKVKEFLKAGIIALGKGEAAENIILDITKLTDDILVLKLSLRFEVGRYYWCPILHFILSQVDMVRKEDIELRASIAAIVSKVGKTTMNAIPMAEQHRVGSPVKGMGFYWSLVWIALTIVMAILGDANSRPGIAFASMKPNGALAYDGTIVWKLNRGLDDKIFTSSFGGLKVNEKGLAHVSIRIRHWKCRSNIAFKVYASGEEVARVLEYNYGLFSQETTTMYIQTIPVEANVTLSVKYVGGGTLYAEDSFMDVLLLPPPTQ
ncbi:hypothetical protein BBO99_00008696 [Phytophthora kernoviae]|uniref:Uncharacterized protein n=2 Tax=Phytophthora kernoviae TaxID=325452 RepID=A0A3R7NAZ6_9STRA|nr:hypothetical protein G195_010164 [Phytophthora kernoviae 00238/432]KAG2510663.1 hypothetical protein JM16_008471 [Phytophthora kernoviae]KAG2514145.1 hypothetical protein JM18_008094 [Phytophthora kernoviae]RLN02933.1 hypothetical protein BBI17_008682 [Phytophthora kernoviae]RLN74866.1 hypothetical protein BBO99_00008696 [Phytophthora kernoviae]